MSPELAHALSHADPVVVGARIRASRVAIGMTQPALGRETVSAAYISRIESGRRRISAPLLDLLAGRLGVSPASLILDAASTEDARRIELELDHGELSLAGGEATRALEHARRVLGVKDLGVKDLGSRDVAVKDLAVKDVAVDEMAGNGAVGPDRALAPGVRARAAYLEAAALEVLGDPQAADSLRNLLATDPGALIGAKAATALCRILRESGDVAAAVKYGEAALDALRPDLLGSEEGVRLAVTLAAAMFVAGRIDDAAALCDEAIDEAEKLASPVARASAYWNASIVRSETGNLDEAVVLARSALALLESTERVLDLGRLRIELGAMMLRAIPPRLEEAQHQLTLAGTELDWTSASPADVAHHQVVSARAFTFAGRLDEGRECALQAVDAARMGMLPIVEATAMIVLGQIAWADGDRDDAHQWYRQAIAVLTGIGSDREAGQLWFELGALADHAGLVEEARDAYRRAGAAAGLAMQVPVVARATTTV